MWLIVLEALGALCVLVFLVWWTMFSGRRQGELADERSGPSDQASWTEEDAASRGGHTKLKG